METISLQQLQTMFKELGSETGWQLDGEMLWTYYFTAATPEALESVVDALESYEFEVDEIFENEEEPGYILEIGRIEKHTPESLFALNAELEAIASKFEGVEYDGMEVNPASGEDEEECECEGKCENCECEENEDKPQEKGCCGGGGGGCHCRTEGQPIENPEILTAIETISKDQSESAQYGLTLALERGLYLVPVFSGRLDGESSEDESIQVLVCTDEKGDEYLPLFTDESALKTWTAEKVSAMVLTAPEAWDFILSQPECSGGVINPGGVALPLNREMVTLLKKMIDDAEAGK